MTIFGKTDISWRNRNKRKTTIATLLYEMFRKMGHKARIIIYRLQLYRGEAIPTEHTTPDLLPAPDICQDGSGWL